MTNIVMVVNLEPILGSTLEIANISTNLDIQMISAMCFNMVHLLEKVGQKKVQLNI